MPAGLVRPLGFASTGVFLADGLSSVGIKADFVQISPYKSAPDPLTKSKMSPEQREQVTWLLGSNHQELVRSIGESRGVDLDTAAKVVDDSPYTDAVALGKHVVNGLLPEEQLPDHLGGVGERARIATQDHALRRLRARRPTTARGISLAIIPIVCTIVDVSTNSLPIRPPINL